MEIVIKGTNIDLTEDIKEWVRQKLEPLARFDKTLLSKDVLPSGRQDNRVDLWVEIGKTTTDQRKGDVFRAELQMRLRGQSVRVEATEKNLRRAITEARTKLQREIKELNERARVQD